VIAKSPGADSRVSERPVLPDVVLEHLEEYAFLSIQRRKLLFSREVTLDQIHDHDARIEAHWDGLVLAVPDSVELATGRLDEGEPWDAFAAAMVWMELGDPAPEAVVEKIAAAEEELPAAWREALRHVAFDTLTRLLPDSLLAQGTPAVQSALAYGRGWHGTLPQGAIPELVTSEHAAVRRSLARAIGWGEAAAPGVNEILRILGDDPDVEVRRAALWSSALVNPEAASGRCRNRIRSGDADAFDVRAVGLLGGAADLDLLTEVLKSETLKPAAVRALGDLGQDGVVPELRAILEGEDEAAAEVAGEALEMLSGADGADSEAAGESMQSMWRRSLLSADPGTKWLRRQVPDGFFSAEPEPTAVPGE